MRRAVAVLAAMAMLAPAARADLPYAPDPVYQKINADDPHPMDDMLALGRQGDTRAQFILGDLYAKGKGGLAQDAQEARRWFEEAAMHGYAHAFIRLAAMAKRDKKPIEAWQWYTLAINGFDSGDERSYVIAARRALVENAPLSQGDIAQARKMMNDWQETRDKRLRAESAAARQPNEAETPGKTAAAEADKKTATPQEKKNEQN